jgi:hypothetical protein
LAGEIRSIRRRALQHLPQSAFFKQQPRIWTRSNVAVVTALATSTAAAWFSRFIPIVVTLGAATILASTFKLYTCNRRCWINYTG